MNRIELWNHIQKTEKMFERRKLKRFAYTVLAFTVGFMLVSHWMGELNTRSLPDTLDTLLGYFIASVISCFINALVFGQLFKASQAEEKTLESLRKQLRELEEKERQH